MPRGHAARRSVTQQVSLTVGAVLTACCVASAGFRASAQAADVELGRYLSSECMTCHGSAVASSAIPDIFGMPEATLTEVVRAYREKRMANPVMQTVASRLSDEEIAALAAYFATAKKNE